METPKHFSMKLMAEDDRPREKLMNSGKSALSDAELLAILLGSGNRNETALQLAQRLLITQDNSLSNLSRLTSDQLKMYDGIGDAKAVILIAAFELGRRRANTTEVQKVRITTSKIAYEIFKKHLDGLPHEEFRMLLLNRANQVIKEVALSKGGITGTVVDISLAAKAAIEVNSCAVVVAHNHPSGQIEPSEHDRQVTKKLREAFKLFDISLLDHLIIGEMKYFSFADEGLI